MANRAGLPGKFRFDRAMIVLFVFSIIGIGSYWLTSRDKFSPEDLEPTAMGKTTIDLMVVYNAAADELYDNDALTRINHLVDVSNQIYTDSNVNLQIRLVHTMKVDYEAGYDSETAVNHITDQSHPAFSNVPAAREQYGADLVVLMRPYGDDGFCGLAWIGGYETNGNFQDPAEKDFGFSHVSIDCGSYVLSHELGHNMGLNHSRKQDGAGGTFAYALGHGVDNDFVTVMAYKSSFGGSKINLFSNPDLICGSAACGVSRTSVKGADAVYTLNLVTPQIADYFETNSQVPDTWIKGPLDSDGNGTADIVLQNIDGTWSMNAMNGAKVTAVQDLVLGLDPSWEGVGREDYDGDGLADLLIRNSTTGEWRMFLLDGSTVVKEAKISMTGNLDWSVVGNGDFDGDGKGDVLLRNADGRWYQYYMNGTHIKTTSRPEFPQSLDYSVASTGDFDGDGKTDILMRVSDGGWYLYRMNGGDILSEGAVSMKKSLDWQVVGRGDFNGDEVDDILLRYKNGNWLVYHFEDFDVTASPFLEITRDLDWGIAATGDFDGDGDSDILVRNALFGSWKLYTLDNTRVQSSSDVPLTNDLNWLLPQSR